MRVAKQPRLFSIKFLVDGDIFIIETADVTLFAQWSDSLIGAIGPGGGFVYYDDNADGVDNIPGARYLEAAPVSTEWTDIEWGCYGTALSGADGTAIGTGEQNTADRFEQ